MTNPKKPTVKDVSKATVRGLKKGLQVDSEVIEEKNTADETRVSLRKVGQNQSVNDTVPSFNEFDEEEIVTKRTYRTGDDLPFPELGSQAEANRTNPRIQARVDAQYNDVFEAAALQLGGKKQAMEHAMKLLASDLNLELDVDAPSAD